MIIDDFNIACVSVEPFEAKAELIVDPDAVLSLTIATQGFQPIATWNGKIIEPLRPVQGYELSQSRSANNGGDAARRSGFPQKLGVGIFEAQDHSRC